MSASRRGVVPRAARSWKIAAAAFAACAMALSALHAGWLQEDIPVCADPGRQWDPSICGDGMGGGLVAWYDYRSSDVYAQRFDPSGIPLWEQNGLNVSQQAQPSGRQRIMPDGAGGAYVAFHSDSALIASFDCSVYRALVTVARIDANGSILWRRPASASSSPYVNEVLHGMFPDLSGGLVLVWERQNIVWDYVMPPCGHWDPGTLVAQRIDADGNRVWGAQPVAVCPACAANQNAAAAQDVSGAITVGWQDNRSYASSMADIYAQKIDLGGNRLWGDGGAPVVTAAGDQSHVRIAPDGPGGTFFSWIDYRVDRHVYAQRLDPAGGRMWQTDGAPVCVTNGLKSEIGIVRCAPASVVIYWTSYLDKEYYLFAQRIDGAGAPLWETNGMRFSPVYNTARGIQAIPDEEGGTVFAWERVVPVPRYTTIRSLWGFASNDIFAVGDVGLVMYFNGAAWSSTRTVEKPLRGVWGTATNNMYAVADGAIIHYSGQAWTLEPGIASTAQLQGIWGSGPNDIWAVGLNDVVAHWNGSSWTQSTAGSGGSLYKVYGTSNANVYAIGKAGTTPIIMHYDGYRWTKETVGTTGDLRDLWVSPDNHMFVTVGNRLLVNDGTGPGWQTFPLLYAWGTAMGIWGTHAANVYIATDGGYVVHWNGSTATATRVSMSALYDVWGTFGSDVWACGDLLAVYHYDGSDWITQEQIANDLFVSRVDSLGNTLWYRYGADASVSFDERTDISLSADGFGNALLAWRDNRNANYDIYARKVSISRGPLVATELQGYSAGPFEGSVRVAWRLIECEESAVFTAARRNERSSEEWEPIDREILRDGLSFSFLDNQVEPGSGYRYRVRVTDSEGPRVLFETDLVTVPFLPLALFQNVPNPFNPSTAIRYRLPARCHVTLSVFDVSGRLVARLVEGERSAGVHFAAWDGRNASGGRAASGIYFCRLQAGKAALSRKMILLR